MADQARTWAGTALMVTGALWAGQANAATAEEQQLMQTVKSLQKEMASLKQEVHRLKSQSPAAPAEAATDNNAAGQASADSTQTAQTADATPDDQTHKDAPEQPKSQLTLGGGLTQGLKVVPANDNNRDGGDGKLGTFFINASGSYDDLSFAAEERFSTTSSDDPNVLRYGWSAYDFGGPDKHHQLKAGLFQVPFGNLRYGYQTYWGNLTYYAGFTDNQAAGLGYKYENGPWRLDIDAFKNDDLSQNSTYGANPFDGYDQVNGGNIRGAYTFDAGNDNSVQISTAVRGGQLEVGTSGVDQGVTSDYGTRWAATAAVDAALGLWTLQAQYVDYRYNIPNDRTYNGDNLPTDAVTMQNYGFAYQMPASGQIFSGNIARTFPLDFGPIDSIQLYDNYTYLRVGGDGHFNGQLPGLDDNGNAPAANPTGDIQFNAAGFNVSAGPVQFWVDVLTGKNSAMTYTGPNDGDWHTRYNFQMGIYFSGDVIKQ